jgi:hypothetical protein
MDTGANGNGRLFNTGNIISMLVMVGMAGGVYATLRSQNATTERATDDLYKIVYDLKSDMQAWEAHEAQYAAWISPS